MKKTTRTARKVLSVFLAVLMMISTWAIAVPGVLAADGNKYYVKVYVNIYDGSDGYGGTYAVEESTGKPKNYSWATNDGWYGRINMTGFTVFGENGDYDAQDVSAALIRAEGKNSYYNMSNLSNNNSNGDWDSNRIDNEVYTFTLDSFPVEIFWMNDENNWDGGNTGFAIRKLTVATSEGGTEHTMWEGLAGSDSETYNYYGSITPTGIHAGLKAAFAETDKSNYDNAAVEYIRLANNSEYLEKIPGTDKTFSVTFTPGKSTNVPNMTWYNQTAGDMAVAEYINPDQNNYLFGQKLVDDGKEKSVSYAYFSGEIPQNTEVAKLMFSPRLVYKKAAEGLFGIQGAQNEAVTMTTHLYITSYDKAELRSATEAAEQAGFNSAYYNTEKYEAYESALKNAKEVLGKAETNQNEIDAATAALNAAIENLKKAEAKFVLTVTHSIYEGKEKSGDATETEYDS